MFNHVVNRHPEFGFFVDVAEEVFAAHKVPKDIASKIKQGFDEKYPPVDNKATSGVYHCIAGSNFAASVSHETHCSALLSCDNVKVLLYKSKDSPFD